MILQDICTILTIYGHIGTKPPIVKGQGAANFKIFWPHCGDALL